MALTALVVIAFLVPLGLLVQQLAQERALAQAERQTAIVASVLAITTDPQTVEEAVAASHANSPGQIAIHLPDRTVGTGHASDHDVALVAERQQTAVADASGGLVYLEPVKIDQNTTAVVAVYLPADELSDGVQGAWLALGGVGAGLVIGAGIVGDRLASRVVRPARRLASAATALGEGQPDVRVQPSGPRELAEAGAAFNQMADRLTLLRTAEREMVADLSHRLRTPLTGLRLDVEALDDADRALDAIDEADRRRTVARIRQAIISLEQEIDMLIRATRHAAEEEPPPAEDRCDAGEVVRERMHIWSAVAADQERPCRMLAPAGPAPVPVPAAELAAALDAVLGNAFRYTPQGTAVEVAVSRRESWVAVRVDDAGAGIADPEQALRRGASGQGSTGLGLDIARRVAEAGGGSVSVDRAQLGGASVVMVFADADVPPRQANRLGLIGRLTREPRNSREASAEQPVGRRWPRQRPSED